MSRRGAIVLAVALAAGVALSVAARPAPTIKVAPGENLQERVDTAPPGATVRLLAGRHRGPLSIDRRISLVGEPGASLVAPRAAEAAVRVRADGTVVSDLEVVGGWTGVELHDAENAVVRNVSIRGSDLQGMLVYKAAATVEAVRIHDLRDPHAQGIEVLSAPDVVVRNSFVHGGKVGIVGHLSDVVFEDNVVAETAQIGVMIREMSVGRAHGNQVLGAAGAGLYCGDESRCEFAGNAVHGVTPAGTGRSSAGWGLVVNYRSTASTTDDVLTGRAGAAIVLANSRMAENSPLDLGDGTAAVWPALVATLASLVALAVAYRASARFVTSGADRSPVRAVATTGAILLITGVLVQSFHMVEHVVQLSRVRFDGVPSRGSLVGSVVDTEWVHLVYNVLVLAGLVTLLVLRRRGWNPPGRRLLADRLVLAAALLQGYHVVEHVVKVAQHVSTGAKVNPGILGGKFDLVLLHFGLNAAIYLAFVAAAVAYALRPTIRRSLRFRLRRPSLPVRSASAESAGPETV